MTGLQWLGVGVLALCALGIAGWLVWEHGYARGKAVVRAEADRLRDHMHDRLSERLNGRYAPHDVGRR